MHFFLARNDIVVQHVNQLLMRCNQNKIGQMFICNGNQHGVCVLRICFSDSLLNKENNINIWLAGAHQSKVISILFRSFYSLAQKPIIIYQCKRQIESMTYKMCVPIPKMAGCVHFSFVHSFEEGK